MRHRRGREIVAIVRVGATRPLSNIGPSPAGPPPSSLLIQFHPGSSRNPHWKVEIGNKTAAIGRWRQPRGRMPNSIWQNLLSLYLPLSLSLCISSHRNAYRPDGRCVRFSITTCADETEGVGRKGKRGRGEEGDRERAWLAGEKRASHEVRACWSLTGFGPDWLRTESYGAVAGGERECERGAGTRTSGVPRLCRWMPKKSAEGGGGFFPIKQPAEFVFSPKRRCRFKVIDCHREGGTDVG